MEKSRRHPATWLRYDSWMKLTAAALATLVAATINFVPERSAHAIAACGGNAGWSAGTGDLPPHAHLVYWSDRDRTPPKLVAKIGGKVVPTKIKTISSAPYTLQLIEIDSAATGKLELGWDAKDAWGYEGATFTVKGKPTYPKTATAKTSRFHAKVPHSTVREVFDGLEVEVSAPAALAHVKLRRDAQAKWTELDVPVTKNKFQIGELGCKRNYEPALLEAGVDIEVSLTLPDGKQVPVENFKRASIPKRAKPTSSNPSDSE